MDEREQVTSDIEEFIAVLPERVKALLEGRDLD